MTERIYGDQNFRFSETSEAVFVTQIGADGITEVSTSNPFPVTGPLTDVQLRAEPVDIHMLETGTGFHARMPPLGDLRPVEPF